MQDPIPEEVQKAISSGIFAELIAKAQLETGLAMLRGTVQAIRETFPGWTEEDKKAAIAELEQEEDKFNSEFKQGDWYWELDPELFSISISSNPEFDALKLQERNCERALRRIQINSGYQDDESPEYVQAALALKEAEAAIQEWIIQHFNKVILTGSDKLFGFGDEDSDE